MPNADKRSNMTLSQQGGGVARLSAYLIVTAPVIEDADL